MNNSFLNSIKIILVGTTHPGNIGASARAMKTMGLTQLYLVQPKLFPNAEATARASGADDILANARVFDSFEKAIKDCHFVFGTSTRNRSIPWPLFSPESAAKETARLVQEQSSVAIVFGRESSGLANSELELCNAMIQIDSNPEFASLNIASAVQIIVYEVRKLVLAGVTSHEDKTGKTPAASVEQIQQLYEHLEASLVDIDYFDPDKPRRLMRRLKRIINRTQLDTNEYNIARGILSAIQEVAKKR